jgi:hypothetical protein
LNAIKVFFNEFYLKGSGGLEFQKYVAGVGAVIDLPVSSKYSTRIKALTAFGGFLINGNSHYR